MCRLIWSWLKGFFFAHLHHIIYDVQHGKRPLYYKQPAKIQISMPECSGWSGPALLGKLNMGLFLVLHIIFQSLLFFEKNMTWDLSIRMVSADNLNIFYAG